MKAVEGVADVVKYLSTFVAILLSLVAMASLHNTLTNVLSIFEGAAIALLSVAVILLLTLYYRVETMAEQARPRRR